MQLIDINQLVLLQSHLHMLEHAQIRQLNPIRPMDAMGLYVYIRNPYFG